MTNNPIHLISFSGGKDSTAMYLLGLEYAENKGIEFTPIFADTGNEHKLTLDFVREISTKTGGPEVRWVKADFSEQFARRRKYIRDHWSGDGIPESKIDETLNVLRPTGNPFLDLCMLKGRFPASRSQFCTGELKVRPINEQITFPLLDDGHTVLSWQGVRRAESANRKNLPRYQRGDQRIFGTGKCGEFDTDRYWIWRPVLNWTVEDVLDIHNRHNLKPNPLYTKGMTRVGCFPCINCTKNELAQIAIRFPGHIDRIRKWEDIVSSAAKRGASTFFPDLDKGPRRGYIDDQVKWSKTSRGGKQFDIFLSEGVIGECESAYGLCE